MSGSCVQQCRRRQRAHAPVRRRLRPPHPPAAAVHRMGAQQTRCAPRRGPRSACGAALSLRARVWLSGSRRGGPCPRATPRAAPRRTRREGEVDATPCDASGVTPWVAHLLSRQVRRVARRASEVEAAGSAPSQTLDSALSWRITITSVVVGFASASATAELDPTRSHALGPDSGGSGPARARRWQSRCDPARAQSGEAPQSHNLTSIHLHAL